ncbi:hypothetical protein CEXT_201651 [Caerostris extrusa]|uniref:Uncharacterized protein n=1 Tax=Caerostris extrusa TaxID=172846 RepID=A0AAV4PNE9_CAEEX|nr:hypothetical protein CEXT_201651 [Caerostris extrusa]
MEKKGSERSEQIATVVTYSSQYFERKELNVSRSQCQHPWGCTWRWWAGAPLLSNSALLASSRDMLSPVV